jgi:uncharacterized protein (TIGR04255 family)
MAKAKARTEASERLPNAPLAEAVFELRWALEGDENLPQALRSDPGFSALISEFTLLARSAGFRFQRDMVPIHQAGGWGVFRRFYKQDGQEFPLLQIGPGIFAANQSADYDWKSFRKLVQSGLKSVLKAYPRSKLYPLRPAHLELRYVDVFDPGLFAAESFFAFTRAATHMDLIVPEFLTNGKQFGPLNGGRVQLSWPVRGEQDTQFNLDYASALKETKNVIQLSSKVVTIGKGLPKTAASLPSFVDNWLEAAHDLLSPFFKQFVRPETLDRFKGKQ